MNYQVCWAYEDLKTDPIWFAQFFDKEEDARELYKIKKASPAVQIVKILKIGVK